MKYLIEKVYIITLITLTVLICTLFILLLIYSPGYRDTTITSNIVSSAKPSQVASPQDVVTKKTTNEQTTQSEESKRVTYPQIQERPKTIKIATWNIRDFGASKARNIEIMNVIASVIRNFDLVAIQEISDASEMVVMSELMRYLNVNGSAYAYTVSPRIGVGGEAEQYAFVYKNATVSIGTVGIVSDAKVARPPYYAQFTSDTFDFYLFNSHIKPTRASMEINEIGNMIQRIAAKTDEKDLIVLGDLNADCSYFKEEGLTSLEASNFTWIINETADTTLAETSCAYDRILFLRSETSADYTGQYGIYSFDDLANKNNIIPKKISDHYPVWAEFYTDRDND